MGQKELPVALKKKLEELFGDRVRFNKVERLVYSHDMGVLPSQVMKLIDTMPDAVAQPVSEEEVIAATNLAREFSWPLIPRGSGTSGFGGALPTRGGIVLDFVRMNRIIAVDEHNLTVTVEPGVVWGDLQEYLQAKGFDLRLYPSSTPSATVAGWVAQGGSGYGSFEYGFCGENIVSVDVVTTEGITRSYAGEELKFVNGLCGITGIITKVTVKIKEKDEDVVVLAAFDKLNDAAEALRMIRQQAVPLWSATMSTPAYIRLKQKASQHIVLPEDRYFLLFVYPKTRRTAVEMALKGIIASCHGELMREALAREEWNERFYPMRFKKLGPTLIATEVIVPIDRLSEFVSEVERKYKGEFALEGTMIHNDKISILGFMLSDERKAGFPLAYTNSLTVIEIGEKLGGRVFTLGLYFADKAKDVLGENLVNEIWAYKQKIDPQGILNPGKIIPSSLDKNSPAKTLSKAMSLANAGKGLIGLAGKFMNKVQGDDFASPLSPQITNDTFACALCGYCRNTCTVFDAVPWESNSPRGKYYLLTQYIKGNIQLDEEVSKALFSCTTCAKCDKVCQIQAHNAHNWMSLRPCFHANGLENTGLAGVRENVLKTGNFWGVPADQKFKWLDVPTLKKGKIAYWAGCWANIVMPNMPRNITRIFNKIGVEFVHFGEGETCCGLYLALGGYMDDFTGLVKKNLEMFKEAGIETMVFSCPGCFATFSENYPAIAQQLGTECNIKFRHVTVFLSELINQGKLKFDRPVNCKVTYHDSCHVGRWFGHYEEPRSVIKAIPGVELVEMPHNRENALCCGLVSAFDSLPTVQHAGIKRVSEAEGTGADFLITNCAGCGSQFNATSCAMQTRVRQKDFTDLVAEALGIETEDPTENIGRFMGAAVEMLQTSTMVKKR
ncbi:FAD-binding and (Fe-S)-binding domain-containing protein [Thermincola potens]|uniref:FAD linked oxidase domain protein n=1 Tax=Thermincola potens (strain JR) TaxID=635013 RepID=D5XBA1_THEPJ|nr:FAD-binding and (Fe-S)-binding domain-containing protein [Thermincola potens]ADG81421.1 FAD linked oxidase domain protein [Thermincola potens JR]